MYGFRQSEILGIGKRDSIWLHKGRPAQTTVPTGCTTDLRADDIVASDSSSLEQLEFLRDRVQQSLEKAKKNVDGTDFKSLKKSLNTAKRRAERDYTRVLNITQSLPKIRLACTNNTDCRNQSSKAKIAQYDSRTDDIRRLTFFVLRRTRLILDGDPNNKLTATTKKLHKKTLKLSKRLPQNSDVCD